MKDCVIFLSGDIYLRGKSFDFAPQGEHVGSLCAAQRWLDCVWLISRLHPRCWTWVVTPIATLHNACLLPFNQMLFLCFSWFSKNLVQHIRGVLTGWPHGLTDKATKLSWCYFLSRCSNDGLISSHHLCFHSVFTMWARWVVLFWGWSCCNSMDVRDMVYYYIWSWI